VIEDAPLPSPAMMLSVADYALSGSVHIGLCVCRCQYAGEDGQAGQNVDCSPVFRNTLMLTRGTAIATETTLLA